MQTEHSAQEQLTHDRSPLEQWLAEISTDANNLSSTWDPGFEGGRQVVIANWGRSKRYSRALCSLRRVSITSVIPCPSMNGVLTAK